MFCVLVRIRQWGWFASAWIPEHSIALHLAYHLHYMYIIYLYIIDRVVILIIAAIFRLYGGNYNE